MNLSALGADNAAVKAALGGKSPDEAAKDAIGGTKLDDVAVRKQLYEGGRAAVVASTDPLIVLMRNVDPAARAVRKRYDDEVDAEQRGFAGRGHARLVVERDAFGLERRLFRDLWSNDDAVKNRVAASIMAGRDAWLEGGVLDLGLDEQAFQTRSLVELRKKLAAEEEAVPAAAG